jgi:hypothetical protein
MGADSLRASFALMGHASIRLTFDTYRYLFKTEEAG